MPDELQVTAHTFTAGQNNQICRGNGLTRADILQIHLRVKAQSIEIRVITDAGNHRYNDAQNRQRCIQLLLARHRILRLQMQAEDAAVIMPTVSPRQSCRT